MNNKRTILLVGLVLAISLIPFASAEECQCHNVNVLASIEPTRLHAGLQNAPQEIIFHTIISNSGTYVEEGISLKIVEQRTGKVLYYNPEQVFLLPAGEDAIFDIIVPVEQLTAIDCASAENGWTTETYVVTAIQKAFDLDCWQFTNWENVYLKVKPLCRKI